MMRRCDGNDPNLLTPAGEVGNCGRSFDDVNRYVICPHKTIGGGMRVSAEYAEGDTGPLIEIAVRGFKVRE